MYRRQARKNYLALAKMKKFIAKKIRTTIRKQPSYVHRDLKYVDSLNEKGYKPKEKEARQLETIEKAYRQQEYIYRNRTHSTADRIVSISQPLGQAEKISFDAYNECGSQEEAADCYKERTRHYPMRVLANQVYRAGDNRRFCKEHGIRLSGPKLGSPSKTAKQDKETEYQDNVDRIGGDGHSAYVRNATGWGLL